MATKRTATKAVTKAKPVKRAVTKAKPAKQAATKATKKRAVKVNPVKSAPANLAFMEPDMDDRVREDVLVQDQLLEIANKLGWSLAGAVGDNDELVGIVMGLDDYMELMLGGAEVK